MRWTIGLLMFLTLYGISIGHGHDESSSRPSNKQLSDSKHHRRRHSGECVQFSSAPTHMSAKSCACTFPHSTEDRSHSDSGASASSSPSADGPQRRLSTCPVTCYDQDCDYWVGQGAYSCIDLEDDYSCDCTGCKCGVCYSTQQLPSSIPTSTATVDERFSCYTGSIPSEYGLLTGITSLDLSGNQLTGSIPTGG